MRFTAIQITAHRSPPKLEPAERKQSFHSDIHSDAIGMVSPREYHRIDAPPMTPDRRFRMKTIVLFLTVTCTAGGVLAASPSQSLSSPSSNEAKNEAVARRVFDEVFNQGRFQVADEVYANDFVNRGLHRNFTLAEDQAAVHEERKAFPDLRMTVDLMLAEGDLVTVVWTFRGTNSAAGYGLPATGAKLEVRGITVWRITDSLIREEWTSFDELVSCL
jgi:steroid delta-isomerase-like uncharacterized protein